MNKYDKELSIADMQSIGAQLNGGGIELSDLEYSYRFKVFPITGCFDIPGTEDAEKRALFIVMSSLPDTGVLGKVMENLEITRMAADAYVVKLLDGFYAVLGWIKFNGVVPDDSNLEYVRGVKEKENSVASAAVDYDATGYIFAYN